MLSRSAEWQGYFPLCTAIGTSETTISHLADWQYFFQFYATTAHSEHPFAPLLKYHSPKSVKLSKKYRQYRRNRRNVDIQQFLGLTNRRKIRRYRR